MLAEGTALILDTETTSLEGEIIELSVIDLAGTTRFDSLVKPAGAFGGTDVHGITELQVASAPSFVGIWPELSHVLGGRKLLAWNAEFDKGMLQKAIIGNTPEQ